MSGGDRTRTCEGLLPHAFQACAVAPGPLLQSKQLYHLPTLLPDIICVCRPDRKHYLRLSSLQSYGEPAGWLPKFSSATSLHLSLRSIVSLSPLSSFCRFSLGNGNRSVHGAPSSP